MTVFNHTNKNQITELYKQAPKHLLIYSEAIVFNKTEFMANLNKTTKEVIDTMMGFLANQVILADSDVPSFLLSAQQSKIHHFIKNKDWFLVETKHSIENGSNWQESLSNKYNFVSDFVCSQTLVDISAKIDITTSKSIYITTSLAEAESESAIEAGMTVIMISNDDQATEWILEQQRNKDLYFCQNNNDEIIQAIIDITCR